MKFGTHWYIWGTITFDLVMFKVIMGYFSGKIGLLKRLLLLQIWLFFNEPFCTLFFVTVLTKVTDRNLENSVLDIEIFLNMGAHGVKISKGYSYNFDSLSIKLFLHILCGNIHKIYL